MSIRVSIVEDGRWLRGDLANLFRSTPGLVCAGVHRTAEAALEAFTVEQPDIVLLDLGLPGLSGLDAISRFKALRAETRILVLTIHGDSHHIFRALEAGASGYLKKPVTPTRLVDAVVDVNAGGGSMSAPIAKMVIDSFQKRSCILGLAGALTAREEETIRLVAEGYASKEIAAQFGISVRTVESHIHHIYEKLHVHSRTQAVAKIRSR